jgi:hypothetical protein
VISDQLHNIGEKELMTALIVLIMLLFTGFLFYVFFSGPKLPPETDAIIERVLRSGPPELITGRTGFASSGGLKIWYQCIAPEGLPKGTVLLITALGGHAWNGRQKFWSNSWTPAIKSFVTTSAARGSPTGWQPGILKTPIPLQIWRVTQKPCSMRWIYKKRIL